MLPKKSKELYPILAERLNLKEEKISDVIEDCFSRLRKDMDSVENIKFNFRAFKFYIPYSGIKKFRERLELSKSGKMKYFPMKSIARDEEKLERMLVLNQEEIDVYKKNKEQKLKWHKEHEDPYGVYSRELEKNSRRNKKLSEKETECGEDSFEENGFL